MKGDTTSIFNFFSQTTRFRIPIYQRPYSWKQGQCEQLFRDIEACASGARQFHFFGSIVSVADGKDLVIIDGQQRITTISLLLLAVRHIIEKFKRPCSYEGNTVDWIMGECILERTYPPSPDKYKLVPIETDFATYRKLVSDAAALPEGNLTNNYRFFVDAVINSSYSLDQIMQGIGKLAVIAISMERSENPQLVFESINSTGLNLAEGDKIRNFVLMDLSPQDQEVVFKDFWCDIEHKTDRQDGSDGIGLFLRDYLTMKTGEVPNLGDIYESVKRHCNEIPEWRTNRKQILRDWAEAAVQYEHLIRPGTIQDAGLSWRMFNINRQEVLPVYPFLLNLFLLHAAGQLSTKSLDSSLGHVDTFVFRRLMCGLPTNSLNKVFKDLAKNVDAISVDAPYEEKIAFALSSKSGNSRIPNDAEFEQGMKEKNVYDMNIKNRAYIFARLEHGVSKDAPAIRCSDAVWQMIIEKKYTIEHVMPQTLTREWREELGGDKAETVHATWLHRLANLTISAYNSEMSNKSFGEKSGRSFETLKNQVVSYTEAQHHVWLTSFIAQQTQWTEAELEARASILAERAKSIWPLPTYSFTPPKALEHGYSLLTHDSGFFIGAKPISFVLLGETVRVSTWRELAIRACQLLNSEDGAAIKAFAERAQGQGLEGHLSMTESENSTKIAEGLFLQTLGSAWDHCQFLRKLLHSNSLFGDLIIQFSNPIDEKVIVSETQGNDVTFSLTDFKARIDQPTHRLTFLEFKAAMEDANRAIRNGGEPICGVVVFREDTWKESYSEDSRSYVTTSDYIAFNEDENDNDFAGWALDGTDNAVWLDEYLSENGAFSAANIDFCYIPTKNGMFIRPDDPIVSPLLGKNEDD